MCMNNLASQFTKLGWKIIKDSRCRTYPSDPRRDEVHQYVAQNPEQKGYDVGINVDQEGRAYFVCDFFDRSIERQLGKNLQHIKQGYALTQLKKELQYDDLNYKVVTLPTGELQVTAE